MTIDICLFLFLPVDGRSRTGGRAFRVGRGPSITKCGAPDLVVLSRLELMQVCVERVRVLRHLYQSFVMLYRGSVAAVYADANAPTATENRASQMHHVRSQRRSIPLRVGESLEEDLPRLPWL